MAEIQPRIYFIETSKSEVIEDSPIGTIDVTVHHDISRATEIRVIGWIDNEPLVTVVKAITSESDPICNCELNFPSDTLPEIWQRVKVSVSLYDNMGLIVKRFKDLRVIENG